MVASPSNDFPTIENGKEKGNLCQRNGDTTMDHSDASSAGPVNMVDLEKLEKKITELRKRYEEAIRENARGRNEEALELFHRIIQDIHPQLLSRPTTNSSSSASTASSTNSIELGRIKYLSLKNHSQLLEDKGDYATALEYALQAKSMDEFSKNENHLLVRICNLSIKLGDSWTPKMLLKLCPEFREKGILPVALKKLWRDITRLESGTSSVPSNVKNCFRSIGSSSDDMRGSVLTSISPVAMKESSQLLLEKSDVSGEKDTRTSNEHDYTGVSNVCSSDIMCMDGSNSDEITPDVECVPNPDVSKIRDGQRISVYWKDDDCWYDGTIVAVLKSRRLHRIRYDDQVVEELYLPKEKIRLIHKKHQNDAESLQILSSELNNVDQNTMETRVDEVDNAADNFVPEDTNNKLPSSTVKNSSKDKFKQTQKRRNVDINEDSIASRRVSRRKEIEVSKQIEQVPKEEDLEITLKSSIANIMDSLDENVTEESDNDNPNSRLQTLLNSLDQRIHITQSAKSSENEVGAEGSFRIMSNGDSLDIGQKKIKVVEWIKFLTYIRCKYMGRKGMNETNACSENKACIPSSAILSLNDEACIFKAISCEICELMTCFKSGRGIDGYVVCKSDELSHIILKFACRFFKTNLNAGMDLRNVFTLQESLLVFESIVDVLSNEVYAADFQNVFNVPEEKMVKFLVEFITVYSGSIISYDSFGNCDVETQMDRDLVKLRYIWCLTLIIRSKRLSSKLNDIRLFITDITSMLKDLSSNYVVGDDCFFLPHIRNSNNEIHRRAISLTLLEIFNHGEIKRLNEEILTWDQDDNSVEDLREKNVRWLEKSLSLVKQIGDPLLLWSTNISGSIIGHALFVAIKIGDDKIASYLYHTILSSLYRKYKANSQVWSSLVLEVFDLLKQSLVKYTPKADEPPNHHVLFDSFIFLKFIWLLSFSKKDKDIFTVASDFLVSCKFEMFETSLEISQTLSILLDCLELDTVDFVMLLIPMMTYKQIQNPTCSHMINIKFSTLCTVMAHLQYRYDKVSEGGRGNRKNKAGRNGNKKTKESKNTDKSYDVDDNDFDENVIILSDNVLRTRCIVGMVNLLLYSGYFTKHTRQGIISSNNSAERATLMKLCQLISSSYEEYSSYDLYYYDGMQFAYQLNKSLMYVLFECIIDVDSITTTSTKGSFVSKSNVAKNLVDASGEVALVMNTLSLLYYDLYDLPLINQPEGGRNSLKQQISSEILPDIFTYVKFLEHFGGFSKFDLRQIYNGLFCHSILQDVTSNERTFIIDKCLFSYREDVNFGNLCQVVQDDANKKRNIYDSYEDGNRVSNRVHLVNFRIFKSVEEVKQSFYWNLSKFGVLEVSSRDGEEEVSSGVLRLDTSLMSLMKALLQDLYHNPTHFESWCKLMRELCHLYSCLQDFVGETISQDELDDEMHIYKENCNGDSNSLNIAGDNNTMSEETSTKVSRKQPLLEYMVPLLSSYSPDEVLPAFLRKKNALFLIIENAILCCENVYKILEYDKHGEEREMLYASIEIVANAAYTSSLQFSKTSKLRRNYCLRAYSLFEQVAKARECDKVAGYAYLMMGKLSWQIHRDVFNSLKCYNKAWTCNRFSFIGANKTLKVALLYQINSTKIKAAIHIAYVKNEVIDCDIDELERMLICLEEDTLIKNAEGSNEILTVSPVSSDGQQLSQPQEDIDGSLWASMKGRIDSIIKSGLLGLRECRKLDSYDFRSVYRISNVIYQLSMRPYLSHLVSHPQLMLPGLSVFEGDGIKAALGEITKLFDKKRPQIANVWCSESTLSRYEQLFQRTLKFDKLRRKYTEFYVDLLVKSTQYSRLVEIMTWGLSARRKTAPIDGFIRMTAHRLIELINNDFEKMKNNEFEHKEDEKYKSVDGGDMNRDFSNGEDVDKPVCNEEKTVDDNYLKQSTKEKHRLNQVDLLGYAYEIHLQLTKGVKFHSAYPRVLNGVQSSSVRYRELYRDLESLMVKLFQPDYLNDEYSLPHVHDESITSLEQARMLAAAWSPFIMISASMVIDYCGKRWKGGFIEKMPVEKEPKRKEVCIQARLEKDKEKSHPTMLDQLTKRQRALLEQNINANKQKELLEAEKKKTGSNGVDDGASSTIDAASIDIEVAEFQQHDRSDENGRENENGEPLSKQIRMEDGF